MLKDSADLIEQSDETGRPLYGNGRESTSGEGIEEETCEGREPAYVQSAFVSYKGEMPATMTAGCAREIDGGQAYEDATD